MNTNNDPMMMKPRNSDTPFVLDKSSPMPLYAQLKEHLIGAVSKRSQPNQRFFTDHQLIEMFGVSQTTVREAVRELIQEGYLYRVRGVGTFVAVPKVSTRLDSLQSYFKAWTAQGKTASAQVKISKWIPCPGWVASLLAMPGGSEVFYIHRIRLGDAIPVASDYRYLPEETARYVSPEQLRSKMIFEILAEKMTVDPPASVRFIVEAAAATSADARVLGIDEGAPVLVRTHVLISQRGRSLSVGKSLFRADLTKWSIDLPVGV